MTPLFDRPPPAATRVKRQDVQRRYREKHKKELLETKKEYARRAEALARRRHLHRHRNEPKPAPPPSALAPNIAPAALDV